MDRAVLTIGLEDDPHIEAIHLAIKECGSEYFYLDPTIDNLPLYIQHGDTGCYRMSDGRFLPLEHLHSVFCRYSIESLGPTPGLSDWQRFAAAEQLQNFLAPLRCIPTCHWINDPWAEARSDCKIYQHNVARSIGLQVPEQLITSDLREMAAFSARFATVIKPLSDASLGVTRDETFCNRPIPTDAFLTVFTIEFNLTACEELLSDGTPVILQRRLDKDCDVRCVVIDENVFSFAMTYEAGAPIDFRRAGTTPKLFHGLTPKTTKSLIEINRRLNVRLSACDLIITKSGEEVFLEANVSGNWLFCDIHSDMLVTRAIATSLLTTNNRRSL